ncbi:MAG: hypothetical protein HN403_11490 [Rhodospirillales bacterium]|jgi:hypothetical protein|nr:hypothetical protein [Rhodospirillales bacterium]
MKTIAKPFLLLAFIVFAANTPATADIPAGTPADTITPAQCRSASVSIQVADTCTSFCTYRIAGRCIRRETRCTGDNGVRG